MGRGGKAGVAALETKGGALDGGSFRVAPVRSCPL
jgi:hypothetical protein